MSETRYPPGRDCHSHDLGVWGRRDMLIASCRVLLEADINPSMHMFGSCIDIDPVAADMAFIQLSLLGIAAEVVTAASRSRCSTWRVRCIPRFYLPECL
ncbi:hypothetical protein ACHWWK_27455 [Klebsiella pneumoniae]